MLGDGRYDGFGNVTASNWTMLMLAKHAVIAVMVGLGVTLHVLATRGRGDGVTDRDGGRVRTVRWLADLIAILGVVVLLLTAMAQSSA